MLPIIGTIHITIVTEWTKEKAHVIIVVENNTLQISRILVTRPKLRRPISSAQLLGVTVDKMVDTLVDVVVDAKVTTRSGETIIWMKMEMIMILVFKREAMFGCAIYVVKNENGMKPILMDFMLLESVILSLLPCLATMNIGRCQVILLVSKLALEPPREAEWALKPNTVQLFLK